jgi:3-deoxy-D-manno-octulosonic-acid transferase
MLIYDLIYFFIILVSIPIWIRALFKKNYRDILLKRISPSFPVSKNDSIWVHAVSVGEVRSLEMLLSELEKNHKNIYLSVTTPSGYEYALSKYNSINVINAPFDLSFIVKKFIKKIKPKMLILNELEIWPNWIHILNREGIKIILINGRISQKAFKMYSFFRPVLSRIFKKIDLYLIQSKFYLDKFLHLKINEDRIRICGNIKADQAETYLKRVLTQDQVFTRLKITTPKKQIIVAASTHIEDELVLIPALKNLLMKYSLILVPRHPDRSNLISEELNRAGFPNLKWSDGRTTDIDSKILIFDEIGYLFSILSIADIVIMGGTLSKNIGGHNFYEPLALKKPVLGGPFYNNFPDIGSELEKSGLYRVYQNSTQLNEILDDFEITDNMIEIFQKIFDERKGTVACTMKEIKRLLP